MKAEKPTLRIVLKYTALQIPDIALVLFVLVLVGRRFEIPGYLFWGILLAWIIKDILFFPILWRAYAGGSGKAADMSGRRGVARERLDPLGYVRVGGELWKAELVKGSAPVETGEMVRVIAVEGLKLWVEPCREDGKICPPE